MAPSGRTPQQHNNQQATALAHAELTRDLQGNYVYIRGEIEFFHICGEVGKRSISIPTPPLELE